jgi:hypothetical protein
MISRNGIERKRAKPLVPDASLVGEAGRVAAGTLRALNEASYAAGASGLVTVLSKWIVEHSKRPLLDARVYGGVLETLVEAISNEVAPRGGGRDVAA